MLRAKAKERAREKLNERLDNLGRRDERNQEAQPPASARDPEFDAQAEESIPADVRMISGCHDTQTSADVSNVATFQLPDAAGKAGGALTSAMLKVVYNEEKPSSQDLTFVDVFLSARDIVKEKGFTQIPQLSSSRMIDVDQPFDLMTNKFGSGGTRYAVLIGINYTSHKRGQLRGCHNDVKNIKNYIMDVGKIDEDHITVLMDDGEHTEPTRDNIMEALDELTKKCESGDTGFVHYSGHGGRVKDETGEDPTGHCSTLCPIDYNTAGQILDKELYQHLVCAMPKGTALTFLADCCHSGTVLDLPYNFVADGEHTVMEPDKDFPFLRLLKLKRVLKDAGVERFRDLLNDEKRSKVKEALGR